MSGRSRASPSRNRRTAHPISSAVAESPLPPPTTAATREATSSADGSEGINAASDRGQVNIADASSQRVAHNLDERPVRDALAVGEAPPAQDDRVGAELAERLLDQSGLSRAGRTEDGE